MAVISRWLGQSFETECYDESNGHSLHGDEPERIGGTNTGTNPFSLLQMSLANCSIGAMLRAARDEKIPVEGLEVEVSYKVNRLDETPTSHYSVTCDLRMIELRKKMRVVGEIKEEQAETLLWAAQNCPVSNTISGGVPIRDELEVLRPEPRSARRRRGSA
jgi:putative redox protein